MNAKISVFAICVEVIIYLLLYNLHDCTLKNCKLPGRDTEQERRETALFRPCNKADFIIQYINQESNQSLPAASINKRLSNNYSDY